MGPTVDDLLVKLIEGLNKLEDTAFDESETSKIQDAEALLLEARDILGGLDMLAVTFSQGEDE